MQKHILYFYTIIHTVGTKSLKTPVKMPLSIFFITCQYLVCLSFAGAAQNLMIMFMIWGYLTICAKSHMINHTHLLTFHL